MASSTAKKVAASNVRLLQNLRNGFAIVHLSFIFYRIIYHWATFTTLPLALYVTTSGVSLFMYSALETNGRPVYDSAGHLVRSVDNLKATAFSRYMFDIIYVVWFTQIMAAFVSEKFWLSFLVIPLFAAYKVLPLAWKIFISGLTGADRHSSVIKKENPSKKVKKAPVEYTR